jgi:CubicO group peptidase (beta-lactamase class C family)
MPACRYFMRLDDSFRSALLRTTFLCAALLASADLVFAGHPSAGFPSNGGLAAKIQPFVDAGVIPGAVLLVADKDKVLDLEAVGYSDYEKKIPIKTDALFMVCSMTKTVTAAGLMLLVDQGKVRLDDPVEKYLPGFKGQMVDDISHPGHPHPPQYPVTIRECMDHTAGLKHGYHPSATPTVTDLANLMGKQPLDWEPGSKYQYSAGPVIGGAVIEAVTGMPYTDYIEKYVLAPLGMTDSSFFPKGRLADRLVLTGQFDAATHQLKDHGENAAIISHPAKLGPVPARVASQTPGGDVWNYTHNFARPDSDLFSTALDYGKFGQMLLNDGTWQGKRFLSPESVREIAAVQTGNLFPGGTEGYGLCTFIQRKPSDDGPSVGSFGHRGARKTVFWVDPVDNLVLVFMTNTWDLKKDEQAGLNKAFFKTAIAKYGKASGG